MANKVYFYEWLSPRSGFEFRLEFFEGSNFLNDWVELVELPSGSIEMPTLDAYDFEDFPTALGKAHVASFRIFLSSLKNAMYDDFNTLILNPKRDATINVAFDDDVVGHSVSIKCGTVINWSIKAHGKDSVTPVAWRVLKRFVHRDGIDINDIWDVITDEVNVKAEDINKFILDQANFKLLKERFKDAYSNHTNATNLYDIVQRSSIPAEVTPYRFTIGNVALMQQGKPSANRFIFKPYRDIFYYIQTYAKQIYRSLIADNSANYYLFFPEPKFYKQLYDCSGDTGAELNATEIYRIVQVRKVNQIYTWDGTLLFSEDIIVGGLYTDQDENSYENMYKSCWDFISDVYEASSVKACFMYNGIDYSPTLKFSNQSVDVQEKLISAKASIKMNLIGKVTSSLFEFKISGDQSDLSNFVENAPGNRNGIEKTLPIYENNMPVCVDVEAFIRNSDESWIEISAPFIVWMQREFHIHKLYYFDNPASIAKSGKTMAIRVHEKVDYVVGGSWVSNVYNTPIPTIDYSTYFTNVANDNNVFLHKESLFKLIQEIQDSGLCIHGVAAKKLMELFGDYPNQFPARTLEVELPFYDLTEITDSYDFSFAGLDPRLKIWFNLASLNSKITGSTDQWLILSSSIDFMEETVKLVLFNVKEFA